MRNLNAGHVRIGLNNALGALAYKPRDKIASIQVPGTFRTHKTHRELTKIGRNLSLTFKKMLSPVGEVRETALEAIRDARGELRPIITKEDIVGAQLLTGLLNRIQRYVETRSSMMTLSWAASLGEIFQSATLLVALSNYGVMDSRRESQLLNRIYFANARRTVELIERQTALYNIRECALHPERVSDLAIFVRDNLNVIANGSASWLNKLPSSQIARDLLAQETEVTQEQLRIFADILRFEGRIVRGAVPNSQLGTLLRDLPRGYCAKDDPSGNLAALSWFDLNARRDGDLQQARSKVYNAYRTLFPQDVGPAVIRFSSLPDIRRREMVQMQLFSRQRLKASSGKAAGLKNPDSLEVIKQLEGRGYRTFVVVDQQNILSAMQVLFDDSRFSEAEAAMLNKAREKRCELKDLRPVFIRLVITDRRDAYKLPSLEEIPYRLLMEAVMDYAVAEVGIDPAKLFFLGAVREDNVAKVRHGEVGWEEIGEKYTSKNGTIYDLIVHKCRKVRW